MSLWRALPWVFVFAACHGGSNPITDGNQNPGDASATDAGDAATDAMPDAGSPYFDPTCMVEWCWVYPQPQGHGIAAIWAASVTDVWAITNVGTLLRYDGSTWRQYGVIAQFDSLASSWRFLGTSNDLWLSSSNFAGSRRLWHWDGTAWADVPIDLSGVFGAVGSTPWVVGSSESREWNGRSGFNVPG